MLARKLTPARFCNGASDASGTYGSGWRVTADAADLPQASASPLHVTFRGTRLDLSVRRGLFEGFLFVTVDGKPANALPNDEQGRSYVVLYDPLGLPDEVTLARGLADGEEFSTGAHRLKWIYTPHVPHGWDCGVLFDHTTQTLLCGDLFTQGGSDHPPVTEQEVLGPSEQFRKPLDYFAHSTGSSAILEKLAAGETAEQILAAYPQIKRAHVTAAGIRHFRHTGMLRVEREIGESVGCGADGTQNRLDLAGGITSDIGLKVPEDHRQRFDGNYPLATWMPGSQQAEQPQICAHIEKHEGPGLAFYRIGNKPAVATGAKFEGPVARRIQQEGAVDGPNVCKPVDKATERL
jgi:hypothetical protein